MSDSNTSHTALIARLAEDDGSLLENPSPLIDAMLIERLFQYSWPTRYLPYLVLFAGFAAFRQQAEWVEMVGITLLYTLGTWWLDHQRYGFAEDPDRQRRWQYWAQRFTIGSTVTGSAWGIFFWLHAGTPDYAQQALLCVMWSGLALSNSTTRSPHLPAFYAFFAALALPLFARVLIDGSTPQYVMGLFGMVLAITFCIRAHSSHRQERVALALRLRNAELVADIDRARAEATAAHVAAEQALAARAQSYATAERLAGFGSWEWTMEDDHLVWSDNMFRMLNLSPSAAPAAVDVLLDSTHFTDRPKVAQFFAALRCEGRPGEVEFRVGDQEGPYGPRTWRRMRLLGIARRDSTGRIVALCGTLRDLREEAPRQSSDQSIA